MVVSQSTDSSPIAKQTNTESKLETSALKKHLPYILPVLVPLVILLATGVRGIDFGYHWDEGNKFAEASHALEQGVLVSTYYKKPSIMFYLTLVGLVPEVPQYVHLLDLSGNADWQEDRPLHMFPAMSARVLEESYKIRTRIIMMMLSSLSLIWVYLLIYNWRKSWLEALVGAAALGLSWEVAYHLRFVAPDGYLMQFGILAMLGATLYVIKPDTRSYLWLAAIASGATTASKYNGGLIIIPVFLAVFLAWDRNSIWELVKTLAKTLLIMLGTFVFLVPGSILAPEHFIRDVLFEMAHYSDGHGPYTVELGLEHLTLSLRYLFFHFFSPHIWIAAPFSVLALIGTVDLIRSERKLALLFLIFPVIYVAYFSTQSIMFARNLMMVMPFLVILMARGASVVWKLIPVRTIQYGMAGLLIAAFVINAGWLVMAAETITLRGTDQFGDPFFKDFVAFAEANPDIRIGVSNDVWFAMVADRAIDPPPNILHNEWENIDYGATYLKEVTWILPSNRPGLFAHVFGSLEVNLNYYSTWKGDKRVVMLEADKLVSEEYGYNVPAFLNR